MTSLKLKFVCSFYDRHHKRRHYFRRKGQKLIPLPGAVGSPEFMAAYQLALNRAPEPLTIGESRTVPGSISAAIAAFYASHTFTKNKPITQATDRNILEAFRMGHGDKPIRLLERQHVFAIIGEKVGKPAAQRNLLRVLRVLLAFAVERGMRADNPALGIKLKSAPTHGYHTWTMDELGQYEARHPIGSKARLALALLLFTAQRRSDIVRLGPPNMRAGRLHFTQSKTGAEVNIPIAPALAEVLAMTPLVGTQTFIVTDYGRPFTAAGFGGWFRERCDQAGLPHCTAHGLRKCFLTIMAQAGCSEDFIASISGHSGLCPRRQQGAHGRRCDGANARVLSEVSNLKD